MLGKSCVLTAIPVCFFYPKTRKTSPMYCGYSNCLFCPKTCKASPMYIWLFQLSFLSLNTRTNAIPIFLSIPSHARQVLCICRYSYCLFCHKTRKASPMYLYSYFNPMSIYLFCPNILKASGIYSYSCFNPSSNCPFCP